MEVDAMRFDKENDFDNFIKRFYHHLQGFVVRCRYAYTNEMIVFLNII